METVSASFGAGLFMALAFCLLLCPREAGSGEPRAEEPLLLAWTEQPRQGFGEMRAGGFKEPAMGMDRNLGQRIASSRPELGLQPDDCCIFIPSTGVAAQESRAYTADPAGFLKSRLGKAGHTVQNVQLSKDLEERLRTRSRMTRTQDAGATECVHCGMVKGQPGTYICFPCD
jgi:hypothetical protein